MTALALLALLLTAPSDAAQRNQAVRAEFERLVPCPIEGPGTCARKGYEADHMEPICAGGKDVVENLQWLSKEQHQLKTKIDVLRCAVIREKRK